MPTEDFVIDDELDDIIKQGVMQLYDRLIAARGQEYYRVTVFTNTTVGTSTIELPGDFYKLLTVSGNEALLDIDTESGLLGLPANAPTSNGWFLMQPFMAQEIPQLMNISSGSPCETRYRLAGLHPTEAETLPRPMIELLPVPRQSFTLRFDYIPVCDTEPLIGADDGNVTFDGINGWEEYVVLVAAIEVLGMEESNTSHLEKALARQEARLEALADNRDSGRPERINDVLGLTDDAQLAGIPRRPRWWLCQAHPSAKTALASQP
jgi:hypothetical protein